jgi:hypothetical protein
MSDTFTIPDHRELTAEERGLLEWLLVRGRPEGAEYVPQLMSLAVVARCTCGCPTLDLAVGGRTSRTVGASTILADAVGQSPEGVPVNVILHAREGEISELEVISMDATEVFSMPKPEMLEVV